MAVVEGWKLPLVPPQSGALLGQLLTSELGDSAAHLSNLIRLILHLFTHSTLLTFKQPIWMRVHSHALGHIVIHLTRKWMP